MNKKSSFKDFLRQYALDIIFISPFSVLIFGTLLSSENCGGYNTSVFCMGYPQFLQHSFVYDMVFMRAAPLIKGAEHWSSALALGILPIVIYAITRNGRFAFWSGILYALWHEGYWLASGFIAHYFYNTLNFYNNFFGSIYYSVVISVFSFFIIRRYKNIYYTKSFLLITLLYIGYLFVWALVDGFEVTVAGGLGQPVLTPFYWDFATNLLEVGSWIFLAVEIIICVFYEVRVNNKTINTINDKLHLNKR